MGKTGDAYVDAAFAVAEEMREFFMEQYKKDENGLGDLFTEAQMRALLHIVSEFSTQIMLDATVREEMMRTIFLEGGRQRP